MKSNIHRGKIFAGNKVYYGKTAMIGNDIEQHQRNDKIQHTPYQGAPGYIRKTHEHAKDALYKKVEPNNCNNCINRGIVQLYSAIPFPDNNKRYRQHHDQDIV